MECFLVNCIDKTNSRLSGDKMNTVITCTQVLLQESRKHLFNEIPRRCFIIKTLQDVKNDGMVKVMPSKACESRRYLLRKEGMGFSLHHTVIYKGHHLLIHYINHVEAVFITKGSGWIEILNENQKLGHGIRHQLNEGTMYALNGHEKHWLGCETSEDMHCICVFVPPCSGEEVQNADGVFPFIGKDGKLDYNYWEEQKKAGKPITVELDS